MADDISESPTAPVTPAPSIETKKKRAPRRSKEEIAAEIAAKQSAKFGRMKKAASPNAAAQSASTEGPATSTKSAGPKIAPKSAKQTSKPPVISSDDFADLIQLESENQKLRKSLAEKLRAENADLRKKLGLS